ncbi:hypothetical protein GCM10012275_31850 [Longimycelium tulufanense]|uniref:Uncharacterized protein n=1 Tax=Longimycelium tulufanense TaxID=907463 RepID=A0A8J3C943_9PSEU|nr:hypothetical protein GCM10012275_31850 [Longimycelium tulufanense]
MPLPSWLRGLCGHPWVEQYRRKHEDGVEAFHGRGLQEDQHPKGRWNERAEQ